jgi:hypothetical protein
MGRTLLGKIKTPPDRPPANTDILINRDNSMKRDIMGAM